MKKSEFCKIKKDWTFDNSFFSNNEVIASVGYFFCMSNQIFYHVVGHWTLSFKRTNGFSSAKVKDKNREDEECNPR